MRISKVAALAVALAVPSALWFAVQQRHARLHETAVTADASADEAHARAAMVELGTRLRGALQAQMQQAGPVEAIDFCQREAAQIANDVAAQYGLRVGRTALRTRSPSNTATPWQHEVLESFARQVHDGAAPETLVHTQREGDTLRVAKGIRTEAVCTVCHGEHLAEPVAAIVRRRYPNDAATGFAEGSLRGMFWAEIDLRR